MLVRSVCGATLAQVLDHECTDDEDGFGHTNMKTRMQLRRSEKLQSCATRADVLQADHVEEGDRSHNFFLSVLTANSSAPQHLLDLTSWALSGYS